MNHATTRLNFAGRSELVSVLSKETMALNISHCTNWQSVSYKRPQKYVQAFHSQINYAGKYGDELGTSNSLLSRRRLGTVALNSIFLISVKYLTKGDSAVALEAVKIDFSRAPTTAFDPTDQQLRDAAVLFQRALDAESVTEEERLWTEIIEKYGNVEAEWVPDIVSRAWGNRGNAKSRQGRMEEALDDYTQSIALAPYAEDPVLNRGVALENLGRYKEASRDYEAVLEVSPNDPAAWNNLGNVSAALGKWDNALDYYRKAVQLSPEFSFAAANYSLALYQVGRRNEAIKGFRSLLRKYPEFPDMRAALAVSLYKEGKLADSETNWNRLEDSRYRSREWVRNTRRWPPSLVEALEDFLDLKAKTVQ